MVKRRRFVQAAGSMALAAGLMPGRLLAAPGEALDFRTVGFEGRLAYAKFAALQGETFQIDAGQAGVLQAQLVEVRVRKPRKVRSENLEQFSILLQGPVAPLLADGLYAVEHWLAGRVLLALVAIGDARYRADFCLLR